MKRRGGFLPVLLLCLLLAGGLPRAVVAAPPAPHAGLWLLVDTQALELSVMRGDQLVKRYENIAIGSGGTSRDKLVGDQSTPLGEYHITEIRPSVHFDLFLAIDYPGPEDALRAVRGGRLGAEDYRRIQLAHARGEPPPQDTRLGGHLGIHGLGAGDPDIQANINWTNGCIALSNEQVEELARLVATGTPVRIR